MRQPNLVRWSCDCLRSWLARSRSTSAPVFDPPRAHQNFGRWRGSRRRAAARRRSLTHRLERPAHTVAARGTGRVLGSRDRCWAGTGNSARHRRPVDGKQQSRRPARRHPALAASNTVLPSCRWPSANASFHPSHSAVQQHPPSTSQGDCRRCHQRATRTEPGPINAPARTTAHNVLKMATSTRSFFVAPTARATPTQSPATAWFRNVTRMSVPAQSFGTQTEARPGPPSRSDVARRVRPHRQPPVPGYPRCWSAPQ
jgi:hypothetical protein